MISNIEKMASIKTIDEIQKDFNKIIEHSQNIPEPKTDYLFNQWWQCKKEFIEVFGGKTIYQFPEKVSFDLGPKEKHDRVIRFAGQVAAQWGYRDLANFIESQEDGFFQNLTTADYTSWDGKVIKKGSKLVKAFRHFIKDNNRSLVDIQNEASRIIQEDKIEGFLCLSVHPLDFLSLSENTYNWRSCHSLDGEFRAGNLSYMMDKNTVICYLKTEEDTILPNFPQEIKWNSKKWRVLLYISNDWKMIIAGRQYPFESITGMNFVLNELLPKSGICETNSDYLWSDWNNTLIEKVKLTNNIRVTLNNAYIPIGSELISLADLAPNGAGSKQFNDVLYSSVYKPIYAFKYYKLYDETYGVNLTNINTTKFLIGGFTYCLWCGKEECLTGTDTMMCEKCELEHGSSDNEFFTNCHNCGRRMYADDAYAVENEIWCQYCIDNHAHVCECCHEYIIEEQIQYDEDREQYLCKYCYKELNED